MLKSRGNLSNFPAIVLLMALAIIATPQISANAQAQGAPRSNSASKPIALTSSNAAIDQLVKAFPALYWYAADACMRETTRHGLGFPQKLEEFTKDTKAFLEKYELGGSLTNQAAIRLRLVDPEVPKEYWILELTRQTNVWKTKTGYKYFDGRQAFDLFKDEYVFGVKAMGSMQPYIQRALDTYAQGKDLRIAFAKPLAPRIPKFTASQLVGTWRSTNNVYKVVTSITFNENGTFTGSTVGGGKPNGTFAGKWFLLVEFLNYEYTASSGVPIPVGTKDEDKLITITKDHYVIQNMLGHRETYVRTK